MMLLFPFVDAVFGCRDVGVDMVPLPFLPPLRRWWHDWLVARFLFYCGPRPWGFSAFSLSDAQVAGDRIVLARDILLYLDYVLLLFADGRLSYFRAWASWSATGSFGSWFAPWKVAGSFQPRSCRCVSILTAPGVNGDAAVSAPGVDNAAAAYWCAARCASLAFFHGSSCT
jgi:hypothetical protein